MSKRYLHGLLRNYMFVRQFLVGILLYIICTFITNWIEMSEQALNKSKGNRLIANKN